jgi:NitT/TauT family transport system ATP-binding protein
MSAAARISIDGVSKYYETRDGEVHALDNASLEIREGEFISLLGPSGCGKSTLLLMIAGLIPRSTGTIEIDGKEVDGAYTDLGIVFQEPVLLDWRKVLANLMLQIEMRGLDKARYRERARELLELTGLTGFEDRFPYELSGGMRQRVAICRGLVHDPPLLLMDEPFGALDALTRDQLNFDVQQIWLRSPKTVVFVTHSIAEAVYLSDRVVVMSPRPGKVEEILEIDLPRPRPLSVRETPEFGQYTNEIRRVFNSLGIIRT